MNLQIVMVAAKQTAVSTTYSYGSPPGRAMNKDNLSQIPKHWTKAEVKTLLRRNAYQYQKVDLPFGLSTPGVDRSKTFDLIFPEDLTGKSVLDLGCNHGYFCFEALRRGAARVVGYDLRPNTIRGAKLLADCLSADVQFEVRDLNGPLIDEEFDYTLCLNVLHHLRDPLRTIDNMAAITRDRLAIEIAVPGLIELLELRMPLTDAARLSRAPVIYFDYRGKLLMTPFAARALLNRCESIGKVRALRSGFKDRFVLLGDMKPQSAAHIAPDTLIGDGDGMATVPVDISGDMIRLSLSA
ncbi:hypothetical protein BH10PSE7_BH10PSE7_39000 [soil metagenome]